MNQLDRRLLRMLPLVQRANLLDIRICRVDPDADIPALSQLQSAQVERLARRMAAARTDGRPIVLAFGAHLIKNGLGPVAIRMMEEGWLTHLATNGAGSIHDWEFAYQGLSGEDVRANTAKGCFGTWEETGKYLNLAVAVGAAEDLGYGQSVGRMIAEDGLDVPSREGLLKRIGAAVPDESLGAAADLLHLISGFDLPAGRMEVEHLYSVFSVQCAAYRLGIPFTVHPGIGYDIIYEHPMNCGGAIGRAATADFLRYADAISRISSGVHIAVGSSVMAPMIFEKSLSMANNLAISATGKPIDDHYMAVVDIQDGGNWDWSAGEPPMDNPAYYLRFCKTFHRMGGTLDYLCTDNRAFLVWLYRKLKEL